MKSVELTSVETVVKKLQFATHDGATCGCSYSIFSGIPYPALTFAYCDSGFMMNARQSYAV